MTPKFPYQVKYDYMERYTSSFETWPEALAHGIELRNRYASDPGIYRNLSVSIYNVDRMDQDSYGLTEEQKAEWNQ